MLDIKRCFVKNDQILFKVIGGESVLVDPYRRELMKLNPPAAEIWNMIDGKRTLGSIIDALKETFDADEETIRNDAFDFMKELIALEMVR